MGEIRQAVDNRNRAVLCQGVHLALLIGTDHDAVEVAGKNARRVLHRLAAADLQVVGREENRHAAELIHTDLKGNTGAGGGLFKNHAEGFARQAAMFNVVLLLILELVCQIQNLIDILAGQIQHF